MNGFTFSRIVNKYKKCPNCGASYKTADIEATLEDEIITNYGVDHLFMTKGKKLKI